MIFAAYLSLLVFGLLDNFRGPFFSAILNEYHLDETTGAAMFALTSISASLFSLKGGGLLRRLGADGLLNFSSACMGVGFLIMGLSPTFAVLLIGAVFFGGGLGFAALAQNVGVAESAPPETRSKWMSGLHAMYALSSALSPWLAHALLVAGWEWRKSFLLVAVMPLGLALIRQLFFRLDEIQHRTHLPARQPWPPGRLRHVMLLGLASAFYLWGEISVGTRWVRWWESVHGGTAASGSVELMIFYAALLGGRLAGWRWSPHSEIALRRLLWACSSIALASLLIALWWAPRFIALFGLSMGPFYPLLMSYARLRFDVFTAQAFTVILGLGSAAVVLMHLLLGWSADRWGLQAAMQIGPIGLSLALLLLILEARIK